MGVAIKDKQGNTICRVKSSQKGTSKEAIQRLADSVGISITFKPRRVVIHAPKGDREYGRFKTAYNYLAGIKRGLRK